MAKSCKDCIHSGVCVLCQLNQTCLAFKSKDDVVEIVRCKDCKHIIREIVEEETSYGFTNDCEVFGCGVLLELTGEWVDVFLDDFCSYGERMERE